jgi:hypothetical protein
LTQFSDNIAVGAAYYAAVPPVNGTQVLGVVLSNLKDQQLGAVTALTATGIGVAQGATGALSLLINGSLATASVATMDVARCVTMTSTANESAVNVTFTGKDYYGAPLVSLMAGPNNNTVTTLSAFLTVSGVSVGAALTSTQVTVGTSDTLGSRYKIANKGVVIGVLQDGKPATATSVTLAAGLTATAVPTASSADVRGTIAFATQIAADASKLFTILTIVDPTTKESAYGQTPYTA